MSNFKKSPHQIQVTISGTWKVKTLADILVKYKHDKTTTLTDVILEFIMRSEEKETKNE